MADLQTLRHSRHALLDGIDEEGVEAIRSSRALVIGAGGLGCPAAMYLTASGIGTLHWVDGDTVDATNLARQTLFGPQDIGRPKVLAGQSALARLNDTAEILVDQRYADPEWLDGAVPLADVVLDCTDRWSVRQQINAACVKHGKALVTAAAIEWSGQLLSINPRAGNQACYACIFDPATTPNEQACGAYGVLSPLVGAMGCLQAAEALKILVRNRHAATSIPPSQQRLSLIDMKTGKMDQLGVAPNPECPVCGRSRQ